MTDSVPTPADHARQLAGIRMRAESNAQKVKSGRTVAADRL